MPVAAKMFSFKVGDVVWAKVPRTTSWPAKVSVPATAEEKELYSKKKEGSHVFVEFYGTKEVACVKVDGVQAWDEARDKLADKCKKATFQEAVKLADVDMAKAKKAIAFPKRTKKSELKPVVKVEIQPELESSPLLVKKGSFEFVKKGQKKEKETVAVKVEQQVGAEKEDSPEPERRQTRSRAKPDQPSKAASTPQQPPDLSKDASSSSSDNEGDDCDLERERNEIMQRNKDMLKTLGIEEIQFQSKPAPAPRITRGLGPTKRRASSPPFQRAKSARIAGLSASGSLPTNFNEKNFELGSLTAAPAPEPARRERIEGDVPFVKEVTEDMTEEDGPSPEEVQSSQKFVKLMKDMNTSKMGTLITKRTYSKWTVAERDVGKVVPERIYSMAMHPSPNMVVAVAGDKWGKVGFFRPDAADGEQCVNVFKVHTSPVSTLLFDRTHTGRLYSSSYDGTVRYMDVEKEKFVEVMDIDEGDTLCASICLDMPNKLYASMQDGSLRIKDMRGKGAIQELYLHHGKISCVDVSSTDSNRVVTGSLDRTLKLWDARKMAKPTDAIGTVTYSLSVTSAYFSPNGKKIVATSYDDTVKIFNNEPAIDKGMVAIRHNNQTGRWLTNFRAIWDGTNDHVAIGSLDKPRCLDIYDSATGKQAAKLRDENHTAVSSLLAFHPSLNVVAGGNSSGRVSIFRQK